MEPSRRSYLDHNASSPLRPEAADAVARALKLHGNASSVHAEGRSARAEIEAARDKVAALVGASAKNVIFTSGGTESNNAVLSSGLRRTGGPATTFLLVGAAEHPCVLEGHRLPPEAVMRIPIAGNGVIDLARLEAQLEGVDGLVLVSIQLANNETGVMQPVARTAELVHARGGLVHSDAVQAAGKIPVHLGALGADAIALSAHKLGGPQGIGAIVLASDRIEIAARLLRGGGQERRQRAGTENVAAIAGFGAAADASRLNLARESARVASLRDHAEAELRRMAPDAVVFGADAERLPNTLTFAVPGLRAETALILLDLAGVALSSGSACSSGKVKRSHVLDAMGVPTALAEGAVRVSLGWSTTEQDVVQFVKACERVVESLYRRRAEAA